MKSIGLRIKEARQAKNLKQDELAELIGAKSGAVVSSWENGKAKPDCLTIQKVCEVLEISPNHLLGYNDGEDTLTHNELTMVRKYRFIDEFGKQAVDSILNIEYERACATRSKKPKARLLKLDFYDYPASAGTGNFLETQKPDSILVKECDEAENADYIIPISGDSMEPTFHDGDKVFVEKCDSVEIGEIGIFVLNGDAYIKELGETGLISHNSAYKLIKFGTMDRVYCCGRVLGVVEE